MKKNNYDILRDITAAYRDYTDYLDYDDFLNIYDKKINSEGIEYLNTIDLWTFNRIREILDNQPEYVNPDTLEFIDNIDLRSEAIEQIKDWEAFACEVLDILHANDLLKEINTIETTNETKLLYFYIRNLQDKELETFTNEISNI